MPGGHEHTCLRECAYCGGILNDKQDFPNQVFLGKYSSFGAACCTECYKTVEKYDAAWFFITVKGRAWQAADWACEADSTRSPPASRFVSQPAGSANYVAW